MIKSEKQFIELMEHIDSEMRRTDVPIPARQLRALSIVSEQLNIPLRLTSPDAVPKSDSYHGDNLSIRIYNWFNDRYGDRLKTRWGPGSTFVVIRGDPYLVHLPLIYERAILVCDPSNHQEQAAPNNGSTINVLNYIE